MTGFGGRCWYAGKIFAMHAARRGRQAEPTYVSEVYYTNDASKTEQVCRESRTARRSAGSATSEWAARPCPTAIRQVGYSSSQMPRTTQGEKGRDTVTPTLEKKRESEREQKRKNDGIDLLS